MNVGQLKKVLVKIPDDVNLELPEGSTADDFWCNLKEKRALLDTEDARPTVVADGWVLVEIPK